MVSSNVWCAPNELLTYILNLVKYVVIDVVSTLLIEQLININIGKNTIARAYNNTTLEGISWVLTLDCYFNHTKGEVQGVEATLNATLKFNSMLPLSYTYLVISN